MLKLFSLFFPALVALVLLVFVSCTGLKSGPDSGPMSQAQLDAPELQRDPNEKVSQLPLIPSRTLASADPLITYCTQNTAPAATPQEKQWRDAFSLEVMERICNKEPEVAKPWRASKYLETNWAYGINLTGVDNGVPRGTAITSRHVIYTKHYGFHGQVGQSIWFLTLDNRWISRKIIEVKYLESADVAIARLETDLPGSITPLKVLDPEAFKLVPDLVPVLRIEQKGKTLLVDKRGEGVWKPGNPFGTVLTNPPERAFAQYYQDMVRFDSSSPSILILRTQYGVMPILYSLVTFGGVGSGPLVHQLIPQIQSTIASFGDAHQLERAMPPATPFSAPSCSVSVARKSDGVTCQVTVMGSADPVTGNPAVSPGAPSTWTQQGNRWTGEVPCPSESTAVFEATLTGMGGTGRTCESGPVGPVVPQCALAVSRRGTGSVCDVSVTQLIGNASNPPVLTPNNPSDWIRSGEVWSGTTSCLLNAPTAFGAQLTDENGTGPRCQAVLAVHSEIPTCEITSRRLDYNDTCEVVVTRKSGVVSGNPTVAPRNPTNWAQNGDRYTGTVSCSTESHSTFSATLAGPLGTGPICKSPSILSVPVEVPFCELQAARIGLSNVCKLNTTFTRGWFANPPPVASPRNPVDWKKIGNTLDYEGTVGCSYNGTHQFSAYYPGQQNLPGRVCQAPTVDKIPAPACNLQVSRQGVTNQCSYTLTPGSVPGTIASYNLDGSTNRISWNAASNVTNMIPCSQTVDTPFTAYVWGPGGVPQMAMCRGVAPKLPPPTCQLVASRRKRTGMCDLTLTEGGVIDSKKATVLKPRGSWLSRSGNIRKGSGQCPTNKPTTFTATLFGLGGSQSTCASNTVPRL